MYETNFENCWVKKGLLSYEMERSYLKLSKFSTDNTSEVRLVIYQYSNWINVTKF